MGERVKENQQQYAYAESLRLKGDDEKPGVSVIKEFLLERLMLDIRSHIDFTENIDPETGENVYRMSVTLTGEPESKEIKNNKGGKK